MSIETKGGWCYDGEVCVLCCSHKVYWMCKCDVTGNVIYLCDDCVNDIRGGVS